MKLGASKNNKRFEEVLGFKFMLHQIHPCTASKIIHNGKKKCAPECVGVLCGPQISQCNSSNGALVDIELKGNESLVCFAMGQTLQL